MTHAFSCCVYFFSYEEGFDEEEETDDEEKEEEGEGDDELVSLEDRVSVGMGEIKRFYSFAHVSNPLHT